MAEGFDGGAAAAGSPAKKDELRCFVVGPIQTNCYAYVSGGACLVVDPGDSGDAVAERLGDVRVDYIAATHGHGDHVGGVAALKAATRAPFLISAADAEMATHAGEVSELGIAYDDDAPLPDRELTEGDVIHVGTATFTVMETPGASCFLAAGAPRAWRSWGTRCSPAATVAPTLPAVTSPPSAARSPVWRARSRPRRSSSAATVPRPRWPASSSRTPSCAKRFSTFSEPPSGHPFRRSSPR